MKRFTWSYAVTLAIVWGICLGVSTALRWVFIALFGPRLAGLPPLVFATGVVLAVVVARAVSDSRRGDPDPPA